MIDETRQFPLEESLSVLEQRVLDGSGSDRLNDGLSVLAFELETVA